MLYCRDDVLHGCVVLQGCCVAGMRVAGMLCCRDLCFMDVVLQGMSELRGS
jgi:hypothetical protein